MKVRWLSFGLLRKFVNTWTDVSEHFEVKGLIAWEEVKAIKAESEVKSEWQKHLQSKLGS